MEGHVSSRVWVSRESVGGRAELRMQDGIGFASDGGALPGHQHGRGGLFTTPQGHAGGHAYGQAPNDHGHDAHGRPSTHPQFFHQGGGQQAMHPGMAYSHPSMTGAYETPSMPTQTGHMLPGASSDSMMHPHASAFHVGPTQHPASTGFHAGSSPGPLHAGQFVSPSGGHSHTACGASPYDAHGYAASFNGTTTLAYGPCLLYTSDAADE